MQGVMHHFHGHAHPVRFELPPMLVSAAVTLLVIVAVLVLVLGVLVQRAG
jgi:hypothetical protein